MEIDNLLLILDEEACVYNLLCFCLLRFFLFDLEKDI